MLHHDRFACGHTPLIWTLECDDVPCCDIQDSKFRDRGTWECDFCQEEKERERERREKKRLKEHALMRKRDRDGRNGSEKFQKLK